MTTINDARTANPQFQPGPRCPASDDNRKGIRILRFSIIVPVYNNPADLRNCIESLKALDYPAQDYEIIVVDNNSTDDTAAVARELGVTCLSETRFQSSYAARNTGIKAAKGSFIAFTDSDCVADKDWLKAIDAVSGDEAAGCFAGEILSVPPSTTVERFSDSIGLLRQKGPLSGWHFKPYAQTANAVYRKAVFDKIGLFDPTTNSGGDAAIAWRMLDKTAYTIRFVPEAIVYHHHRTSVPDLYAQFHRYGGADMALALLDENYQQPAVSALENDVIDLSAKHLQQMEDAGVDDEIIFSGLELVARAARLSGYQTAMLGCTTEGAPIDEIPGIARKRAPTCNICGSKNFEAGPNGRLFEGRAPKCIECGSLERHRMLFGYLTRRWNSLGKLAAQCVGASLPRRATMGFASFEHVKEAEITNLPSPARYDIVFSTNQLAGKSVDEIGDWLEQVTLALEDTGTLLLLETKPRLNVQQLSSTLSGFLPSIKVSSVLLRDTVTGDSGTLLVLEPATANARENMNA
ncbi:glycosyltransferase [Hoeflea ulvae]|uniref:Glycosyltransferase n=1 Tax=Hoeflea ulvae TaxID=2983764 RepID=A0ABT3YKH8_9HYPH|nr:glycosyltransferase [Hoeflea ulvae]MCY0096396.1 glycosyltransferase [Hoeflea ulvae]